MRAIRGLIVRATIAVGRREEGAIGWLLLGVLAGIALVIFGVYKLLFD